MKEKETIDLDEAVAQTALRLQCSHEEAYRMIREATLKGELPSYTRLDDGFLRRTPLEELRKK